MPDEALVLQGEILIPPLRPRRRRRLLLFVLLLVVVAGGTLVGLWLWKLHKFSGASELISRANKGDAAAAFELGKMYQKGSGGAPNDAQQAMRWYQQAANAGERHAQYNLGLMYWNGEGTTKDYATALGWFQKSAAQGIKSADLRIGFAYLEGLGVPQSFADGFAWTKKAAEGGLDKAQAVLCLCYVSGIGVPKDPTLGYAWCLVAQASGSDAIKKKSEEVSKKLSRSQLIEAQSLASSWWTSRPQHTPMPEHSKEFGKLPPKTEMPRTVGGSAKGHMTEQPSLPLITSENPAMTPEMLSHMRTWLERSKKAREFSSSPHLTPLRPQSRYGHYTASTSGCEAGHWVKSVSGEGTVVALEDGSMWEVSEVDTVDTQLWLPTEDVVVCDGKLINTDSGDSVEVTRPR